MAQSDRLSGTVTFLFTDIEGSTSLLKRLGRIRYAELLARQQVLLRDAFAAHGGEEIDTQGDSFLVAFRSASDAIASAVAIQRLLADHEWAEGVEVKVRIGVHSGEASAAGERYVGFSVHRAARIGSVAHGRQVLLSDATRVLVEDDLPEGVNLRDLGLYRLKDVDRPERLSQVTAEGLRAELPPLRGAEPVKARPVLRRRSVLAAALVGVIAAAVAIPVFALSSGGSGGSSQVAHVGANSVGAFDASNGKPLASSALGATPGALAVDRSSLWVANPDGGTVTRIDSKSRLKQTITVGADPSGLAVGGGFVWVTNALSGTVSKIDPNANGGSGAVVDTILVGNGPSGIAFDHGRLWVANSTDRTVMEFEPDARTPRRTIAVAGGADALAAGFGFVWVVSGAANSVSRIAVGSGTPLVPIHVGNSPIAVSVGEDAVWVANNLDGTISRIDPRDATINGITVGGNPGGIAAGPGSVWVSDARAGTVSQVDPIGMEVGNRVVTGNQPGELAQDHTSLYVSVRASGLAHRGGTLTVFADGSNFDSIDPSVAFQTPSWSVLSMTNDGLVTFERAGGSAGSRLVPDLATSIPVPGNGGRTYTFQVRQGVRYSNGAPVEPADFRRAIERSLSSPDDFTGFFSSLVGATACKPKPTEQPRLCDLARGIVVDRAARTVTFHLRTPDPDFLYELASPQGAAVPSSTPLRARLPLPATGPYRIAAYDPEEGVTLMRNARFREWSAAAQPSGYPGRIVLKFGVTPVGQVAAVQRGKGDYALVSATVAASLRRRGHADELHVNPQFFATSYFFLGTRFAPFNDVRVRRAVNLAIDRRQLLALAGGPGSGQQTCQVLPPNVLGYVRDCAYRFAPATARRLVAASGTAGEQVTLWAASQNFTRETEYLRSVLASLGYRTRIRHATYEAMVDPRNRAQVGAQAWFQPFPSASGFFAPLLTCPSFRSDASGRNNPGLYCNPTVDSMITRAQALQIADPQSAGVLWSKIDRKVGEDAPWIAYSNPQQSDFVSSRVGGYQYNPVWGPLFDQMWVR